MLNAAPVVFMLDVDNTLLDNDRFTADLTTRLDDDFGKSERERYWAHYAGLRDRLGYADYLGALQAFRDGADDAPALLRMSAFVLDYPFGERLYPRACAALARLATIGTTAIVSDGDIVFQPRKIQRSGLWDAVGGRVLVTVHKQRRLDLVQRRFPADRYVMIDDKPQLLAAMKRVLGDRLTTVFVRQGHYAAESAGLAIDPAPDITIEYIGNLCALALSDLEPAAASRGLESGRQYPPETTTPEQP